MELERTSTCMFVIGTVNYEIRNSTIRIGSRISSRI